MMHFDNFSLQESMLPDNIIIYFKSRLTVRIAPDGLSFPSFSNKNDVLIGVDII